MTLGARASRPHPPPQHKGWSSRGYLPHIDAPDLVQAITFRLTDSLPRDVMERLKDDPERRRKIEAMLDAGQGSCLLRGQAADIVQDALLHFDGERYRLLAWVIMPNHVHCLIETARDWPVHTVVHSWKSFTAKQIDRVLGQTGRLWQPEYFDRYIRDDDHLVAAVHYIEHNPVKAGLVQRPEDWIWGSAFVRAGRPRSQESTP